MIIRLFLSLFLLLLCVPQSTLQAQSYCNMTMELSISTGYNYKTGGKLPAGSPQDLWEVSYVSSAAAALYPDMPALPYPAYIPAVIPWPLSEPRSNWISYLPDGTCSMTGAEDPDSFYVTYTRHFYTCMRDSFLVSINIANDDYCSAIRIDGKAVPKGNPFVQPAVYNESNYRNWTTIPEFTVRLSAGEHTIAIDVHNIPAAGKNLTGLNMEGKLFTLSSRNSLVSIAAPKDCRCSCAAPIKVHAWPKDTVACMADSVLLHVEGADRYSWHSLDDSWLDTVENPLVGVDRLLTTYTVEGTDGPCAGQDTLRIHGRELPSVQVASRETTACIGAQLRLAASGAQYYLWSPGSDMNNAAQADPLLNIKGAGVYTVKGWDEMGCTAYDTFSLKVFPQTAVKAFAEESRVDCQHSYVQLYATGAASYTWQPAAYFDNPASDSPRVTAPGSRVFTVTGTDQYGCHVSDSVLVTYAGNSIVKMPSAFSPNNDRVNDELKPIIICDFRQESMQVFNRWGNLMFDSGNPQLGWDGTSKGTPCDGGTYFYILKGKGSDGAEVVLKGSVVLLR